MPDYELIIDTEIRPAPADLPLRSARGLADAELKMKARPHEIEWLHANPLLWLHALTIIMKDVENQIAKNDLDLKKLPKGADGSPARQAYVAARQDATEKKQARLHFRGLVMARRAEVASLCGPGPLVMAGWAAQCFDQLAMMIEDGDHAAAARFARATAARVVKENTGQAAPDNRHRGAVNVHAAAVRAGGRELICRACQVGRFNPVADEPRCTRCGQLHRLTPTA